MTALFGASAGVRALGREAFANHTAKAPQYHLRSGGMYLHDSGSKLQPGSLYAWKGTIEQARKVRATFSAAAGCKAVAIEPDQTHGEQGI